VKTICAAIVLAGGLLMPGFGNTLGSWGPVFTGASGSTLADGGMDLEIDVGSCIGNDPCNVVYRQLMTPASIGQSYLYDSSAANFGVVTGLLTNNQPDLVWELGETVAGSGGGNGAPEAVRFGLSTTDFAGNTITDLKLSVSDVQFENFNGGFWATTWTLTVEGNSGTTPEPGTGILLSAVAGAGLLSRRLMRRR